MIITSPDMKLKVNFNHFSIHFQFHNAENKVNREVENT